MPGSGSPRLRRGQAPAISAAILTFAVLAMAIALYAYFTSQIRVTGEASALLDHLAWVSTNLDVYVQAYSTNETGTRWLYCYTLTIYNAAGSNVGFYATVIPASRVGPGTIFLSPAIARIPLDTTVTPPVQTAYMYYFYDIDRDGFTELVGFRAGSRIALAGDPPAPSCYDIYSNITIKTYDLPYVDTNASSVYLVATGQDLASQALFQVNVTIDVIPLWTLSVPAQGKTNIFVFVESPVELGSLLLAVVTQFNDGYYTAMLVPLPVGR